MFSWPNAWLLLLIASRLYHMNLIDPEALKTHKSCFHCLKCVSHWVNIYKIWNVLVSGIVRIDAVKEWKTQHCLHGTHCFLFTVLLFSGSRIFVQNGAEKNQINCKPFSKLWMLWKYGHSEATVFSKFNWMFHPRATNQGVQTIPEKFVGFCL